MIFIIAQTRWGGKNLPIGITSGFSLPYLQLSDTEAKQAGKMLA